MVKKDPKKKKHKDRFYMTNQKIFYRIERKTQRNNRKRRAANKKIYYRIESSKYI